MPDIWVREEGGGRYRVGITEELLESYKEFLYVEFLKKPGEEFGPGEPLVALESLKSVYELSLPFGGVVEEVNARVSEDPSILGEKPGEAWLVVVRKR